MKKVSIDRELNREMAVGVFAFLVVLGLLLFSIFIGGEIFVGDKCELKVLFEDVVGLRKGERVVCRGMAIGEVKNLELLKGDGGEVWVAVLCYLDKQITLREGYSITIEQTSILGGRLIRIEEGSGAEIDEGAAIIGRKPYDIVKDAGQIVGDVRATVETNALLAEFASTVIQAREIVEKINNGEGSLGQLVNDEGLYEDLRSAATGLKNLIEQLEEGEGLASALLNDEAMNADMRTAVRNLSQITQRLADGKGLLGSMLAEDELAKEAQLLVEDIRAAVDDFRETAPILTFTSIFFGAL